MVNLIVHPDFVDKAEEMFKQLGIRVVTGRRFLGGFIGGKEDVHQWLKQKIESWIGSVKKISNVAKTQPQAAFTGFTKSLQAEWAFIQQVMVDSEENFCPLREAINESFIPNLFAAPISEYETNLVCRPSRFGGLGINDPVKTAAWNFDISKKAASVLSAAITEGCELDLDQHEQSVSNARREKKNFDSFWELDTVDLLKHFPPDQKRCISRKIDFKCSGWLSAIPIQGNHFEMSPDEFRDSIALRYGRVPVDLPSHCDADNETFDVTHALNCARGGLVYARHNELRDLNCSLLELAGLKHIISEPIVKDDAEGILWADWGVRGFWEPQKQALFDGCILNADSPSLIKSSLESIFNQRKEKKNKTYSDAAKARRATFSPIIATCDAVFDKEAEQYFKRLATHLAVKWQSNFSYTLGFVRARMQMCVLRSVSLCLRGNRTKWRGAGVEDGAALPSFNFDI